MQGLTNETVMIIGLGEIGHTLFELLNEKKRSFSVFGLDLDEAKMHLLSQSRNKFPSQIATMHVCLPCGSQEKFVDITVSYIEEFKPNS